MVSVLEGLHCTYLYIHVMVGTVLIVDMYIYPALEQPTALHGVVSVHTSSGAWGTGLLVEDGIIITCAHVIRQDTGTLVCYHCVFHYMLS